jgi:peptidyl-prolyl cis-trans isomerase SurA
MQKIGPAVRHYLTRLREEAYIDIRPGYTDSDASPNETKPTFMAYTPPQPKKKKKQKARYDTRVRYSRGTVHAKTPVQVASAKTPEATSPTATSSSSSSSAEEKTSSTKKHEAKREKFRFGRAPQPLVAAEQAHTSAAPAEPTPAGNEASTAENPAPGNEVQPLGPDLEHAPLITQPKVGKTRFSDEARNKSEMAARKNRKGSPRAKKVKHDNAKPAPLTTTEETTRQVQSAPLGLNGATAEKKKKKKKVSVNPGEKTRLSDQKKTEQKKSKSGGTTGTPSSSDNNGSGGTPSSSAPPSSTDQP